jgi:DNA-directed RNA polymerase subunit RPC12/RpoP
MINIGTLLDACGISYTAKQLKKLDRLFNHLVKGNIFKNFPGIGSKDNSYKDLSPHFKSLKVYFIENKEKDSLSENDCSKYFEPETENNIVIKEEILEENVLEIKEEFDPLTTFETVENYKYISDNAYEEYSQNQITENEDHNSTFISGTGNEDFKQISKNTKEGKKKKKKLKRIRPAVNIGNKCRYCKEDFSDKLQLRTHISEVHNLYPCTLCERKCASEKLLNNHFLLQHRNRKYNCCACDMSFKSVTKINLHMKQDHGKILEYFCARCDEKFRLSTKLVLHIHNVHENDKVYQCKHCDMKFLIPAKLTYHIRHNHLKIKPFFCEKCGKSFGFSWGLKEHIAIHHTKGKFYSEGAGRFSNFQKHMPNLQLS